MLSFLFSSPEGRRVIAIVIFGWSSSVVRRQQLLQRTSPAKIQLGYSPNLAEIHFIQPSSTLVQMVSASCISRSYILKIDFEYEALQNLFV